VDKKIPKRALFLFFTCFWASMLMPGFGPPESVAGWKLEGGDFKSNFTGGVGYRTDELDWNISGDISGGNPGVLSELKWDDLSIFQIRGSNTTLYRGLLFKGHLAYGWIVGGDNQDSDFLGDDRTIEFSRSNNDAGDGSTFDASAGIGYRFSPGSGFIGIGPMAGYSYHRQNLVMTDGNQTVTSPIAPALGPVEGLDSAYDAEWKGPWVGVDLTFQSPPGQMDKSPERYELNLGFQYHWADYHAEADWNLRTDFAHPKSFEHDADGDGIVLSAELCVFFNQNWALSLSGDYQQWETEDGTDRTFFADGTIGQTRLNEVNWTSYGILLGCVYSF